MYHFIVPQPLCGFYGPVQTGFTNIHVLGVGVLRQLLHESPNIQIVVIIYMTEPPIRQRREKLIRSTYYTINAPICI